MDLTVKLKTEEWEFILEVLNMNSTVRIKEAAIGLLKPQLEEEFLKKSSEDK